MQISINIKVLPFGQISLESAKGLTPHKVDDPTRREEKDLIVEEKLIMYKEPKTFGIKTYEVLYEQDEKNYISPATTG